MAKKRVPTEQEIAKKHGVDVDYVIRQAEVGSTVEREHVTDHKAAYGIALQHIAEFPDYYKHLLSMEKTLKKEWEKKKPIKENVSSGNARRARMGGIQSKPTGPITNAEVANSQSAARASFAARVKAAGDAAHKTASEKGMSPSEAEMRRKSAERKASKIKEDHIPIAMGKMLDSEGAMIKNQLETIERSVELLRAQIKGDDMQVPAWVQAKVTLATESILTCANYMAGKDEEVSEACWKGYKQYGMKKKGGRKVPNCVPEGMMSFGDYIQNEEVNEEVKTYYKPNKSKVLKANWQVRKQAAAAAANNKKEIKEVAAWQRKEGKNKEGGLNEKGRKSYENENPGSDLKAPSTEVGNPRRKSFCSRMRGMKAKLTSAKTANDPNSRINKSLRAWNC
jgi:hypothetical protein